ncbi:hypothetical protein NIZ92_07265 [Alcaligenes sp. 1735tsa3]|uniref:hypothetical protein n=1 Tax=Alcaligenes sp. 1735tsa3 TaxID=2953809 RepID=UPI0020A6F1DB|nr:hypothetical protein [Alcaligenes sp. 1735tsa3]USY26830.1 hypothetical protein NIZ92_07265 [Alcaligenes sp. 1735tsa3]
MLNEKKTAELHPPKAGKKRAFFGAVGRFVFKLIKWWPAIQSWIEKFLSWWE